MPKVPNESPQISLNVPGVQAPFTREFGKVGSASEQVGTDLQGQSERLNEQVQQLAALDASQTAMAADKIDSDYEMAKLKLSSADGLVRDDDGQIVQKDGRAMTIADQYHDWADSRYQKNQGSMPNGIAQSMYQKEALNYYSNTIGTMGDHVHQMQVSADKERQKNLVQAYGNSQEQNPSLIGLYDSFDDVVKNNNSRVGLVFNKTEADAQSRDAMEKLGRSFMNGNYLHVFDEKREGGINVQDIHDMIGILHGDDKISKQRKAFGQPTLSETMDPQQKYQEEKHLLSLIPLLNQKQKTDLNARFDSFVKDTERGRYDKEASYYLQHEIQGLMATKDAQGNPLVNTFEGAEKMGRLAAAIEIGKTPGVSFDALPRATQEDWARGAEQRAVDYSKRVAAQFGLEAPANVAAAAQAHIHDEIWGRLAKITAEKNSDYSAFAQRVFAKRSLEDDVAHGPDLSKLDFSQPGIIGHAKDIQNSFKSQEVLMKVNPPDDPKQRRVGITQNQSWQMADRLKDSYNYDSKSTAKYANALGATFGKYTEPVIHQMVIDNHLSPGWSLLAMHMHDKNSKAQEAVVTALQGGTAIDANFKATHVNEVLSIKDFESQVHDKLADGKFGEYANAQASSYPNSVQTREVNNAILGVGANYVKMLMTADRQMDVDTAVKTAEQHILAGKFKTGQVGGHTWAPVDRLTGNPVSPSNRQMPYVIPTTINTPSGTRMLGPEDQAHLNSNLKDFTDHLEKFNPVVPTEGGKPAHFAEHWMDQAKSYGGWTRRPDQGGWVYRYKLKDPETGAFTQDFTLTHLNGAGKESPVVITDANAVMLHPHGPSPLEKAKQGAVNAGHTIEQKAHDAYDAVKKWWPTWK